MTKKPIVFGGMALLFGYCAAALARVERPVSFELMRFHRHEQMVKLRQILGSVVRFRKMDKFLVGATVETKSSAK